MSLTAIKICLLLGAIGHVLCRHCDCNAIRRLDNIFLMQFLP